MRLTLNTELSDKEIFAIGSIVSQWGFIESDIFEQTLLTFGDEEDLPKAMQSNAQFALVLELWLDRVVDHQDEKRRGVLLEQYKLIKELSEFRQAIVHSRWEWKPDAPETVVAVRVHKHTIKRVRFTIDDLADFATKLGEIRFSLQYPGGLEDHAERLNDSGGYMSRRGWELLSGRTTPEDLKPGTKKR